MHWYNRHRHHKHYNPIEYVQIAFILGGATVIGAEAMAISMNDLQSLPLAIEADDALGSAVPLPTGATVVFTSDAPAVLAVTANADGVTAVAKAASVGTANITAVLTLPGGTAFTSAPLAVTVISSAIASIKIVPGTPA